MELDLNDDKTSWPRDFDVRAEVAEQQELLQPPFSLNPPEEKEPKCEQN